MIYTFPSEADFLAHLAICYDDVLAPVLLGTSGNVSNKTIDVRSADINGLLPGQYITIRYDVDVQSGIVTRENGRIDYEWQQRVFDSLNQVPGLIPNNHEVYRTTINRKTATAKMICRTLSNNKTDEVWYWVYMDASQAILSREIQTVIAFNLL